MRMRKILHHKRRMRTLRRRQLWLMSNWVDSYQRVLLWLLHMKFLWPKISHILLTWDIFHFGILGPPNLLSLTVLVMERCRTSYSSRLPACPLLVRKAPSVQSPLGRRRPNSFLGQSYNDSTILQSGEAGGRGQGFVTYFLRVPQTVGLNCSCHAAQASKGNFQKTCYKTFYTTCLPRLYS